MDDLSFSDEEIDSFFQPKFTIWSTQELLEMEFPEVGWLVENLIPIPGLTFIAGKSGHGKSLVSLSLAKSLNTGSDFVQHFPTQEHKVLILDLENPGSLIQERFNLFKIPKDSSTHLISTRDFLITNQGDVQEILDWLAENDCKVVILDCLIRMNSLDENHSKEMRLVKEALDPFLNAGLAVIVLHHQGKGMEQKEAGTMRGSSDLEGMADSVLIVSNKGRMLTVTQTKSRNSEAVPAFEVELVGNSKESLELVYRGEDSTNKLNQAKQAIVELLESTNSQLNQSEICETLAETHDLPANKVRTALSNLLTAKKIVRRKGKNGAHFYSLWNEEES